MSKVVYQESNTGLRVVRRYSALFLLWFLLHCLPVCAGGDFDLPPSTTADTPPGVAAHDLRGSYRLEVCGQLDAVPSVCDEVLRHFAGETPPLVLPPVKDLAQRYRIVFVPGLFSECFEPLVRPFEDVMEALRAEGFHTDYFGVSGRGTVSDNAARLALQFFDTPDDTRKLIVFAYSKGLIDTLEMLLDYPATGENIAAVVSMAGAANGSPLADQLNTLYLRLGAWFPLPGCAAGSGMEIRDLSHTVRRQWWQAHRSALTVPLYALVAAPRPEQVSTATWLSYQQLARTDPFNDGKLLWEDQVPPGSRLLGFVNADHWTIAVPVASQLPWLSFMFRDDVPRTVLVESAIKLVAQTLAADAQARGID